MVNLTSICAFGVGFVTLTSAMPAIVHGSAPTGVHTPAQELKDHRLFPEKHAPGDLVDPFGTVRVWNSRQQPYTGLHRNVVNSMKNTRTMNNMNKINYVNHQPRAVTHEDMTVDQKEVVEVKLREPKVPSRRPHSITALSRPKPTPAHGKGMSAPVESTPELQ